MTSSGESGEPLEDGSWSIREIADAFGLTHRALRHYDELLKPRIERGQRLYDARSRLRLQLVLKGKQLGFSLREMAAFMASNAIQSGEIVGLLNGSEISARLDELKRQRSRLDSLIEELRLALAARAEENPTLPN